MKRGEPDHQASAAAALLSDAAVSEVRARMTERCEARVRAANTNDVEECRGAVATFQANAAFWSTLESLLLEQEQRDKPVRGVV